MYDSPEDEVIALDPCGVISRRGCMEVDAERAKGTSK